MFEITFISDYVCPYCLVAKEALKEALIETGMEAKITWVPFELTPEPRERVDTYSDPVRRAKYKVLDEPCKKLGLDMKLPPYVVPRPYTRMAFEGWFYACDREKGDVYNDMMYRAYFVDEKNIGDIDVLVELAGKIGLDKTDFRAALEEGRYTEKEKEAVAFGRAQYEINGVPTIYINGVKVGLQEFTMEEMIRLLGEQYHEDMDGGFGCGPEGC